MQHIVPTNRLQVSFSSLEELVAADEPVRFLDAFAEKLDLSKLGFKTKVIQQEGRLHLIQEYCSKSICMDIRTVSDLLVGWKRNANGIRKCNGSAGNSFPTTTLSPTFAKTIRWL